MKRKKETKPRRPPGTGSIAPHPKDPKKVLLKYRSPIDGGLKTTTVPAKGAEEELARLLSVPVIGGEPSAELRFMLRSIAEAKRHREAVKERGERIGVKIFDTVIAQFDQIIALMKQSAEFLS